MGFRTVVVLFNDQASEWESDPLLGKKISQAMSQLHNPEPLSGSLGYGRVVECAHADSQTMGIFNNYDFAPVAHGHWHPGQWSAEVMKLELVHRAADKLGYRLVKKSTKRPKAL